MRRTIRIELTIETTCQWPGDDEACQAALNHVPSGVIEIGDNMLLIESMTAEVVHPILLNPAQC